MRKLFYPRYKVANPFKRFMLPVKTPLILSFVFLLFFSATTFGQAGDVSQVRNGNGNVIKVQGQVVGIDTCGSCWVNGNAGSSNAHYREGYSIAYRSLITGLTPGTCYEYVLEYDTYHGAVAIDYLTHYQRLEPHGPFGHIAEVVNPLAFESGSTKYNMPATSVNTFTIPPPAASGIASGSTKNITNQPTASYNALPANQRLMTIFNGVINDITYEHEDQIAIVGNTNTSSSIRVRFTPDNDSAVLAWGGHIASRTDWGNSTASGKPLSAGGISGSPYHMRQISMNLCTGANIPIGNQDRSLSAAAVFPPPDCPSVTSQTQCAGSTSFVFSIASPQAGVTYTWSFGTNTIDAAFAGNLTSATGTNVTVVHNGGGAFTTAGSFSLNITAVLNSVPQECLGVATGTIEKTVASASANPTTIDITSAAHNTTLTAGIAAGSSDADVTHYTYQWSILSPAVVAGTISNTTARVTTYTAGLADAGSTITFQVVATHIGGAACVGNATTSVGVNSIGACDVSPQTAVCAGTETTHTGSPNPKSSNATYVWSLGGFGGSGTTTATLKGGNSGTVTQVVVANSSYRITLTQTYANTALNTSCFEDVTIIPTPTVSAIYNPPGCTENTFSIDVPNSVVGSSYRVTQGGEATPTYDQTKAGTGSSLHFTGLAAGGGFFVRVTTGTASCTATTDCGSSTNSCTNPVAKNDNTNTAEASIAKPSETYKITLESPTNVTAAPNPFTEKVRFNLISAVSGRGSLELYNVMGQKIGVVYEGYFQAGKEFAIDYNVTKGSTGTLIYVFKVGDQKVTGKLISMRK